MKKMAVLLIIAAFVYSNTTAQIIKRKVEEAKNKTEQRIENKSSESIDNALNKIEEGIGNLFKKKKKKKEGKNTETPPNEANNMEPDNSLPSKPDNPNDPSTFEKTDFSKHKSFDFIPGQTVLFFEDFINTRLGTDTAAWSINTWSEGEPAPGFVKLEGAEDRWFKTPQKGVFWPNALNNTILPENFTLEFDVFANLETMSEMEGGFKTIFVSNKTIKQEYDFHFNDLPQIQIDIHPSIDFFYLTAQKEYGPTDRQLFRNEVKNGWKSNEIHRISMSRNGSHVKVYVDEIKYIDLPNALPIHLPYLLVFATNMWGDGLYVSNIRLATDDVAANRADIKSKITTSGKFVTNAVQFDVNSSWIKPESWATLKEIAQAINTHSDSYFIIGHTDSDGNAETNLILSQKRANAIKYALVKEFGVNEARLTTMGKGESEPIENNLTPSGKAKNRRVEFIKQP